MTQPGVRPITALAFVLTIGDATRFRHSKQVASYLGLIPRERSSGSKRRLGAITRRGNCFLRQFPPEIRKVVYTTNAIESLNMSLRKAIKTRGAFPSEDAALKAMYLALRNLARKWNAVQGWKEALNRFALVWEARFPHQGI